MGNNHCSVHLNEKRYKIIRNNFGCQSHLDLIEQINISLGKMVYIFQQTVR